MKYEYKHLDFYTESSEQTVHTKIKDDLTEMLKLGWQPVFTMKFANIDDYDPSLPVKRGEYTTVFLKKQVQTIEE